jgi:hypothetical protein
VFSVVWSADGTRLASAGEDGTVRVLEVDTGASVIEFEGHRGGVFSVVWSADGTRLASVGEDGSVRVWDIDTRTLLATLMASDSTWLATCAGAVRWGGDRSRVALAVPNPTSPGSTVFVSPGRFLAMCDRPDLVRNGLAGDPPKMSDVVPKPTWRRGVPWDGTGTILNTVGRPPDYGGGRSPRSEEPAGFRPGSPLRAYDIPGRRRLLADLVELVDSGSSAVLKGPLRAGKTSVLNALERRLEGDVFTVYKRLENAPVASKDELVRSLVAPGSPGEDLLRRLLDKRPAVVLVDEVVNLDHADSSTFAWLRSLSQSGTTVVLAGTHSDWESVVARARQTGVGAFGNDVKPFNVGPILPDAAREFLAVAAARSVTLDLSGTFRWIIDRCGSWPFYLQGMGFEVVRAVQDGDRRVLDNPGTIGELYERLFAEWNDIFRKRWDELPLQAQAALLRACGVPPGGRPTSEEEWKCELAGLWKPQSGGDGTWVEDKPFFDWICRRRDYLAILISGP